MVLALIREVSAHSFEPLPVHRQRLSWGVARWRRVGRRGGSSRPSGMQIFWNALDKVEVTRFTPVHSINNGKFARLHPMEKFWLPVSGLVYNNDPLKEGATELYFGCIIWCHFVLCKCLVSLHSGDRHSGGRRPILMLHAEANKKGSIKDLLCFIALEIDIFEIPSKNNQEHCLRRSFYPFEAIKFYVMDDIYRIFIVLWSLLQVLQLQHSYTCRSIDPFNTGRTGPLLDLLLIVHERAVQHAGVKAFPVG